MEIDFVKVQQRIFNKIYKDTNPRNEREFDDIITTYEKTLEKSDITKMWKTYSLWAFGSDATACCVCEDIPEHYITCHTCNEIICNDCFENDILRGDSFYMVTITDQKGQMGAYYCKTCYNN